VNKSWMTSLAGIIVILMALAQCYSAGHVDLQCVVNVLMGGGLLVAKDYNVTGGTKPAA
jgi:hypothetical protein